MSISLNVRSPLSGTVVDLQQVPDPIFAMGTVGAGIAVIPDPDVEVVHITAPVDGLITRIMPHLFVIQPRSDVSLLVHLGVDTARLRGQGFDAKLSENTAVKQGQVISSYAPKEIGRMGFDPIVMVVAMQLPQGVLDDVMIAGEPCQQGDKLYRLH
ncbi:MULTISPECIES: PTS sugar transporter subunit IIA [Corynebacterium]|uniref:PTS sugar transporter subunit IIA n=1 Tax=Corynebacterium TaxID=1716 RepID=UPI0008A287BE|nr:MULTISPECIES: PTS glucose transporter subunit IIA [Corynebacterium]MCX2163841.1 PTS glucose transporter subunit IIA [Corynebacterium auriscanis]OFT89353.1 PTS sugar transporter subunit IIBC [Corynebacterium sp. HMSC28B08]WJY71973.1 Glucose-specific phosphotransferase enzyme IIA component [Corynebacterium auriscanis]